MLIQQSELEWKSASEIIKDSKPGDVIEIELGSDKSYFMFNIKNGWCVHVTRPYGPSTVTEVIKDTTDLSQEAGLHLCRINNFESLAEINALKPRSLKDSLQIARSGLAHGPISIPISDVPSLSSGIEQDEDNFSKAFCVYWKYMLSTPSERQLLSFPVITAVLSLVGAAAAAAWFLVYL